jgi:hypothetical protein
MDVGVDSHDFKPWHFDEIQTIMTVEHPAKVRLLQEPLRATSATLVPKTILET